MAQYRLKPAAKILILLTVVGIACAVYFFGFGKNADEQLAENPDPTTPSDDGGSEEINDPNRVYKVALSEWPGHMPLVVANGGLTTQPGSAAAKEGIRLEIVFIEDPVKKNAALQTGNVDFVWQVVDEMPINMGSYQRQGVDARAFLQIDWSRGGDACVASKDVRTVEDIFGRKSAMMMFSPDHTLFEFMIGNSRLTPQQILRVRKDTSFSMDDFKFGRVLFAQGKVDVACLWEPDVSLALKSRRGSHRLFSTADATELIADVLLAKQKLLTQQPQVADKLARAWFAGVEQAQRDKRAAAKLISSTVPRFKDELGESGTFEALDWVKWTGLADNVRFFGLDTEPAAFDRVYNQADGIWTKYPEAEIVARFVPAKLRNSDAIGRLANAKKTEGEKLVVEEPEYEPEVARTGAPVFTKSITINFLSGRSDLDAESMHIVNRQVLPQLEMAKGMYVRIEGNTDNVGDEQVNRQLSEARAQTVVNFLISKGVDRKRIVARGNGASNPVASNKTADGRAVNRRTEMLFISRTGK